jgi:hypothetical protein
MLRVLLILAVACSSGCGTEAPCQGEGAYCEGTTLCIWGQPTECATEAGRTCGLRTYVMTMGPPKTYPGCVEEVSP